MAAVNGLKHLAHMLFIPASTNIFELNIAGSFLFQAARRLKLAKE
jgi:hypothetical protein